MGGYYRVRLNTGTHDPLYVKAIVLEEGGVEVAIAECDLVGLPRTFVDAARRIIRRDYACACRSRDDQCDAHPHGARDEPLLSGPYRGAALAGG